MDRLTNEQIDHLSAGRFLVEGDSDPGTLPTIDMWEEGGAGGGAQVVEPVIEQLAHEVKESRRRLKQLEAECHWYHEHLRNIERCLRSNDPALRDSLLVWVMQALGELSSVARPIAPCGLFGRHSTRLPERG